MKCLNNVSTTTCYLKLLKKRQINKYNQPIGIALYLSDILNHFLGLHGIPWTSRNYESIIIHASEIMVPWNQMYFSTSLKKKKNKETQIREWETKGGEKQMNFCKEVLPMHSCLRAWACISVIRYLLCSWCSFSPLSDHITFTKLADLDSLSHLSVCQVTQKFADEIKTY